MPDGNNIVWYPGHMAAAKRELQKYLPLADLIIELRDSRIPLSSANPDIKDICAHKPRLILLTKTSLADDARTAEFKDLLSESADKVIPIDCKTGKNIQILPGEIKKLLSAKIEKNNEKGMSGKRLRAIVLGITNVGKSTFINTFTKTKKAKAEDRPGVTRQAQWISAGNGIELLDTPGLLWHKFDDPDVGIKLALTGAIRDEILDISFLTSELISRLRELYPRFLEERYRIKLEENDDNETVMRKIALKRGFLVSGGETDEDRLYACLLDEFRAGKIGKITLDRV
ncbi:MAG: ribosome biogenesis GTPase YlqF [Clostridia bacterium]|nr:ribosome biogenesis GTPase YlqF [Clostridia bacterium]